MNKIQQLRNDLEQQKGRKSQIESDIEQTKQVLIDKSRDLKRHEQAREVIREVGLKTCKQLQYHISEIATLALSAVFLNPYELKAEFVERRNKTECDLLFERDGKTMKPLDASGGGAVDIASFALRVASWSMARPRSRPVLFLDEPFKHLKGIEANHKVLKMLKQISNDLNIQIIMVSDERIPREDIIEVADKVFESTIHKGITNIKEITA